MPQHLIILMGGLYGGQEATVRIEYGEAEWLPKGKGVRHGALTSLFVQSVCREYRMKNLARLRGSSENWSKDYQ